jgi:hypothetical protein
MESLTIQSSPCPLCGENAFTLESWTPEFDDAEYSCLAEDDGVSHDPHLHPCECTGCGNVHMVVRKGVRSEE